jgi:uncharacterized protein YqhQ
MPDKEVGGQAIIEGVMIRSPRRVATAVRSPEGEIIVTHRPYIAVAKRHKLLNIPILRGAISFFEMLIIGIQSLNFSADIAAREPGQKPGDDKPQGMPVFLLILTMILGLGLGIFLFFFIPLWLAQLAGLQKGALGFNLVAGAIRVALFVSYVWLFSLYKDFRRVFEYHGAEHKSIYAHENNEELTVENILKYSTLHPRCGTSFLLIVAIFAILTYSVSDSIYQMITGVPPPLLNRFLLHFSLLPFVAGVSYELLKWSGRHRDHPLTRIFAAPGLWLQKITTKEPSPEQIEVAVVAVLTSLEQPLPESTRVTYT